MSTATAGRAREHRVLAIDPGNVESAFAHIDACGRPFTFDKVPNDELIRVLRADDLYGDRIAVEMVASYGMAVGKDVFETCVWIGRFVEALEANGHGVDLVYRRDVKLHHCHSAKAKDSNIRQALVDRFAPGQPNHGKGTKAEPGWFYGFRADVWQAYALAVYVADVAEGVAA
jgi:hypothetical protein